LASLKICRVKGLKIATSADGKLKNLMRKVRIADWGVEWQIRKTRNFCHDFNLFSAAVIHFTGTTHRDKWK